MDMITVKLSETCSLEAGNLDGLVDAFPRELLDGLYRNDMIDLSGLRACEEACFTLVVGDHFVDVFPCR